jgi:hypothetical protein
VLEKGGDEQLDESCEKYYAESSGREIICPVNKKKERRLTVLVTSCEETAF